MKKYSLTITAFIFFILVTVHVPGRADVSQSTSFIRKATVKIINTYVHANAYLPWKFSDPLTGIGSGTVIGDNMILTNAHITSDSTFLQVQKENDPNFYNARVLFLGHDCDLALITVNDKGFFKGTTSLEFGGIPELRSKVTAYGYPEGGEKISITEGIVSRIEISPYSHTGKLSLLTIQTDAAINPGNSGGPAIQKNKIAGVTFQTRVNASNIGFLIPVPVIKHFLDDVKDGSYDGFPTLGIIVQELQNKSFRDYLGMKGDQTGILVTHVIPGGSAENRLRTGDIIMKIDSKAIANDGSYSFLDSRIKYTNIIDQKHIGDQVSITVLRKGKTVTEKCALKSPPVRIPWYNEFDTKPRYYIFGGIVFQTLNKEYLKTWNEWWNNANETLLYYYFNSEQDGLDPWRKEFVVLNQVLPDPSNTYISDISDRLIEEVNGKRIASMEELIAAFKSPKGKFHVIKTVDSKIPIVINASEVPAADKRIMKNYKIDSLSSIEVH